MNSSLEYAYWVEILNVRDDEVAKVGLLPSMIDVWEACGSVEKHKYTWDVSENDNLN